ncbi:NUDIX hydrolase [Tenacibaculum insulae]|uniref:NUDIX hydrolase n=1 Tax=Tenacibaculum insulae TaxID=2029677 RepID=UPI003AB45CE0
MYKVFVNDKPIIFTTSLKNEEDYVVYIYKNTIIEELIYKLKLGKLKGVYLFTPNLEQDWGVFKLNFKVKIAAGGLVLNTQKEILFIYRGTKWDLPKGRTEAGESLEETAVREVEEECGVTNLVIDKKLTETYHFFIQNGKHRVKETHWYLMHTSFTEKLTPQIEEGITKAVFKDAEATKEVLKNTFSNIITVFDYYIKL